MRGEIIAIGDELLSGRILNSTSGFAARHLFEAGHDILALTTIGDDQAMIADALERALGRAEFIIVTGGLGATSDDLTNEAVAAALERPATFFPEVFANIKKNSPRRETDKHPLEKLAWLPAGAEILNREAHMAGHLLVQDGKPIFFLPGVPEEMAHLLTHEVIPQLANWQGKTLETRQQVYKVFGLPETIINGKFRAFEDNDPRVKIGYYPVFPEVHVSLTIRDHGPEGIEPLFLRYDAAIREALGEHLYGTGEDTLEGVIGGLLAERGQTVAAAESCTGGLVAHTITRNPGSSAYFLGGVVTYSNALKESLLQVERQTLLAHGAVSAETARTMAAGCRKLSGADYALSVTGIAGPSGGSTEKPVGTVYVGLAVAEETPEAYLFNFRGERGQIQTITCFAALDLLRRKLLNMRLDFEAKSR